MNRKKNDTVNKSRRKKITLIILTPICALLLLIIGFVVFITTWSGSPDKILAVANQLQVPSSWVQDENDVVAPHALCFDDGGCPRVQRSWHSDRPITPQDIIEVLGKSHWQFPLEGKGCTPPYKADTATPLCNAEGSINGFTVDVWLGEDSISPHKQTVTLIIRKS